jgi:hypothetical protein
MIISYFKFKLSEDSHVPNFNGRRYNMIEFATIKNGLLPFKNKQGKIYLDLQDYNNDYNIFLDSAAYVFYTATGLRLTATYLEDDGNAEFFYAYDDLAVNLFNNSSVSFTNDGYLIIIHHKCNQIEIIGFADCKGLMATIYPIYTYGHYDYDIYQLMLISKIEYEIEYKESDALVQAVYSKY